MNSCRRVESVITYCGKGITPRYVDNSEIIILNQKCIRNNTIDYSLSQFCDDTKEYNKVKFLKLGDIIINSTGQGTAGRVAFVEKLPDKKVIVDSHILVLRTQEFFEARCLNYFLFSIEQTLQTFIDGSTGQGEFDKVRLFNLRLNYPTDNRAQQAIVAVLSSLDNKILLNNNLRAELEAMAKTLYAYWFVQFDFPNEKGEPYKSSGGLMIYNDTVKQEIPEGWNAWRMDNLVDCNKWTVNNSSDYGFINYLDTSNLTRNTIDSVIKINCHLEKVPSRAIRVVGHDDILISTVRPNQCHHGIIKNPVENLIASSGFAQLRSKRSEINSDIIYYHLTSERTINRLQQIAESSVSAYPSISHKDILDLNICLPEDKMLLKGWSKTFSALNEKIALTLKENKELATFRDWLLPMLMNGQVKVSAGAEDVIKANINKESTII